MHDNQMYLLLGAWITTGGTYCGIMKHVGKAVRDHKIDNKFKPVVLLGIVPWGKINNQQALLNTQVITETYLYFMNLLRYFQSHAIL